MGKKGKKKKRTVAITGMEHPDQANNALNRHDSKTSTLHKKHDSQEAILGNHENNPLRKAQEQFLSTLSREEQDLFFDENVVASERRAEIWDNQASLGEDLVNKYAWAIPNPQAVRIIKHFSPIIEIGCGSNAYWGQLLHRSGVDIVCFDNEVESGGKIIQSRDTKTSKKKSKRKSGDIGAESFRVRCGGPEMLSSKDIHNENRTLFLCYPDEDTIRIQPENEEEEEEYTSLGMVCLDNYKGEYLIHVGELYGDTLSCDQAPWGRSSSSLLQERLASEFHCLLKAKLEPGWLYIRDTISVWKRSKTCSIVFQDEDEKGEEGEPEESEYRHIPPDEQLPHSIAAPCLMHLLTDNNKSSDDDKQSQQANQENSKDSPNTKLENPTENPKSSTESQNHPDQKQDQTHDKKNQGTNNRQKKQETDPEPQEQEGKTKTQDSENLENTQNTKKKDKKRKKAKSQDNNTNKKTKDAKEEYNCPW